MENTKQDIENDSDNEDIFFGPITKKEIMSKLKYYDLCKDELLEPLEVFKDIDILNDSLIKFYEDIFTKCDENTSQDENSEVPSYGDQFQDSLEISKKASLTESKLLQSECYSQPESYWNVKDLKVTADESALLNSTCSSNTSKEAECSYSSHEQSERETINSSHEISECVYNNSADNFNCTLEEMEMLLKFGEHYITESKITKPIDISSETEKENDEPIILKNSNRITKSPVQDKENKLFTPSNIPRIKSPNQNKENKKSPRNTEYKFLTPNHKPVLKPNTKTLKTSPSQFKVERSPVFKNIQSPIAMYIKNSARVPLVQNVTKATIESNLYRLPNKEDLGKSEKELELPEVGLPVRSYKKAPRAVVLSDEPEPALPPSIRRLINGRVTPQIIKHVARTHTEQPPPDNDLTILSTSQVQAQPDVSFYISKNAARTNRLQRL